MFGVMLLTDIIGFVFTEKKGGWKSSPSVVLIIGFILGICQGITLIYSMYSKVISDRPNQYEETI